MSKSAMAAQRKALGAFLRRLRAKLSPTMVGLAQGTRRRTPGLRREEVAALSGISATWYSWIEQGRDISLSGAALARVAGALRLTRAERGYLFELAGKRDPSEPGEDEAVNLPSGLEAVVRSFPSPSYLLDRYWRARTWNEPAERLFVGWLDTPGDHGLLEYIFLEPVARAVIRGWEDRARRILAEFRVDFIRHMEDPEMRGVVADLARRSPLFARAWDEHAVIAREGGERTFNHPRDGFLRFEQIGFNLSNLPDFKLMVLMPLQAKAADRTRRKAGSLASAEKARSSARRRSR